MFFDTVSTEGSKKLMTSPMTSDGRLFDAHGVASERVGCAVRLQWRWSGSQHHRSHTRRATLGWRVAVEFVTGARRLCHVVFEHRWRRWRHAARFDESGSVFERLLVSPFARARVVERVDARERGRRRWRHVVERHVIWATGVARQSGVVRVVWRHDAVVGANFDVVCVERRQLIGHTVIW